MHSSFPDIWKQLLKRRWRIEKMLIFLLVCQIASFFVFSFPLVLAPLSVWCVQECIQYSGPWLHSKRREVKHNEVHQSRHDRIGVTPRFFSGRESCRHEDGWGWRILVENASSGGKHECSKSMSYISCGLFCACGLRTAPSSHYTFSHARNPSTNHLSPATVRDGWRLCVHGYWRRH